MNENKREFEIMQKVQRFRLRLTNAHYLDLMAPTRQFVREGTLRMVGTAKQKDAYGPRMVCYSRRLTRLRTEPCGCSLTSSSCVALPKWQTASRIQSISS